MKLSNDDLAEMRIKLDLRDVVASLVARVARTKCTWIRLGNRCFAIFPFKDTPGSIRRESDDRAATNAALRELAGLSVHCHPF